MCKFLFCAIKIQFLRKSKYTMKSVSVKVDQSLVQKEEIKEDSKNEYITNQSDYISLLCRKGSLPQKYHRQTDFFCLIIFIVCLIIMMILIFINGLSNKKIINQNQNLLWQNIIFGVKFFIWEQILAALAIMIIAMIISLITLVFPLIMTLIALLALLLFPCYLTIRQILKFVATNGQNISYLLTGLLSLVGLIVIIFMIAKRKDKIKNLPTFLKISTLVIKSQMCSVFAQLIIFSIIEVGIWVLFSNLFFAVASIDNSNFINFLTKAVVLLVWIFTNGFFISLSDYFIQALAIYWFYSHSNPQIQQHQFKSIQDNLQQNEFSNQQKIDSHKVNFEIYNSLKRHIGTVMFGALLAYIPTYFIAKIHKLLIKSSSKQYFFVTFSKYCFVETILEEMNFNQANQRTFQLRKRIKTTMPQLYMLGHFYGDIIKLCLCIIGIILLSEFTDDFLGLSYIKKYFWSYTFTVVAFGFGLGLQIATNFANIIGMCGDVAFIMYCIDLQIQRVHYGKNCNYSTPIQLMEILKQLTIKRKWNQ